MLDPITHDLLIENGDLVVRADLAQAIKQRILMVRGEWFLNPQTGVPYYEELFVKKVNLDQVTALFREVISETPAVREVVSVSAVLNAQRQLTVTWSALGDEGLISGAEVL